MAWEGSTRKDTLPPDWHIRRRRVLLRDAHRCTHVSNTVRCPAQATDVDHIGDRNDHNYANLRSLCAHHHLQKSSQQGGKARAASRKKKLQPTKQAKHPGLKDD